MSRPIKKRPIEIPRPILYYNFDDNFTSGLSVVDVMGSINGTINGTVTTGQSSRTGQSYLFDGTSGFIDTGNSSLSPHVGGSGTSTWAALINIPTPSVISPIIAKRAVSGQSEFIIAVVPDGTLYAYFSNPGDSARFVIQSVAAVPLNTWCHVAVTFDAGASAVPIEMVEMYINGVKQQKNQTLTTGSFTSMTNTASTVKVGTYNQSGTPEYFTGMMGEIQWFSEVLSASQIQELSNRSLARKKAYNNVPVNDYYIWWSARNVDGQGNRSLTTPNVATLTDLGTAGKNGTQGTSTKQPLLRPFRAGNRAGIKFDGTDDIINFASETLGDYSIFFLMKPTTDITSASGIAVLLVRSNLTNPQGVSYVGNFTGELTDEFMGAAHINGGSVSRASAAISTTKILSSSQANLIFLGLNGNQSRYRLNGVDLGVPGEDPDGGLDSGAGVSLQNIDALFGRDTSPLYTDAVLYEVLIFDRVLTELEIVQVENWMAEEYPDLEFQQLVFATNPDTTVDDEPVVVNVEAAGLYPEPFSYWSFDNSDFVSTTMIDLVGGNNGTEAGTPVSVSGQVGQAREFDGATEYYALSDEGPFDFDIDSIFSFAFWINTTSTNERFLFGKAGNGGDNIPGYTIRQHTGGLIAFYFSNLNGTSNIIAETANFSINDGNWHHVVITYDGSSSASGFKFYVNGILDSGNIVENSATGSVLNNIVPAIGIRGVGSTGPNYFDGTLDELAVWSRELTANEVFEVYKRGAQGLKLVE